MVNTMKTTSVTAHYERKLNTGDYSSVTLSAWATVEVEPGDNDGDALAYAMELCRDEVRKSAGVFTKRAAVSTNEHIAGLPVKRSGNIINPDTVAGLYDAEVSSSGYDYGTGKG